LCISGVAADLFSKVKLISDTLKLKLNPPLPIDAYLRVYFQAKPLAFHHTNSRS